MTKKSDARILHDLREKRPEKVPRVDDETLLALNQAKETAMLIAMENQEADLNFRRMIATACRHLGQPIDRSIVCLSCGLVRPMTIEQCPDCSG